MDDIPAGYTRVTEPLKRFTDFSNIPPAVLANAADRGTRVHKYCELFVANMCFFEVDIDCEAYVDSFREWYKNNVTRVLYSELRINSARHMLSGAVDLVCELNQRDGVYLIDIKTPATESKTWALQTAAYGMLMREELGIECHRVALMLPKKGGSATEVYYHHWQDEPRYMAALDLHRYFNGPIETDFGKRALALSRSLVPQQAAYNKRQGVEKNE